MTTFKVGYFVGSLSTSSINRLLAAALVKLAPRSLHFTEIPFRDLPLYCVTEFYGFIERVYTAIPRETIGS